MATGGEVLVFASRDAREWPAARALASEVGGRFVDRLAGTLEELDLVAAHRVVEPVVVVVLVGGKVTARYPRLVTAREVASALGTELSGRTGP